MLFNSAQYGIFFVIVFTLHWLLPKPIRRTFLLIASFYFYASAIPQYLLLILGLTAFNYAMGLLIDRAGGRMRKAALVAAIAGNLASLSYFKYSELIVSSIQPLLRSLPLLGPLFHDPLILTILLPLGISFFTFEFIHYTAEVYKGLRPMRNPVDFALFAAFFPTQIAGPIKRFPDFVKQLQHPRTLREVDVDGAVGLILRGLVKKVLVADTLAPVVAAAFARPEAQGWATAWFAVFAFATQIYCDFSGYTDIGRGCAELLGYVVPENFNRPYQAATPAEFWHRWHMSLSTWLRDYLFIPLGGSRVARPRVYLNLMITMALGGLWHGPSWHFMVWGIYQGVLLCGHRLWSATAANAQLYQRLLRIPSMQLVTRAGTLLLVCGGWVFFRADSMGGALAMLHAMGAFSAPALAGWHLEPLATPVLLMVGAALVVVAGWCWAVFEEPFVRLVEAQVGWLRVGRQAWARTVLVRPALYSAAILLLVTWPPHTAQRFIYFQF